MPTPIEFSATPQDWEQTSTMRPWNLLVHGGVQAEEEDRCKAVLQQFPRLDSLGVNRVPGHQFSFQAHWQGQCQACEGVGMLRRAVMQGLTLQRPHVLLDLTSLELDLILYLLPWLLEKKPASLFGIYLVPAQYGKKRRDRLELLSIRQPQGYVSFLPGISGIRDAAHYVLLGFDRGRAGYFFDRYDWDWAKVHSLTGDPPYAENGVDKALAANEDWLKFLPKANQHRVAAQDPFAVKGFFQRQLQQHEMLDIVPIGPKPMLLGILLFYLSLPETEQSRVRLLYDFPRPRKGCTQGVSKGFLYDCGELLNHG